MSYITSAQRIGRKEGFLQGMEKGIQKGKQEGGYLLLLKQLKCKFGRLSKADNQRLTSAGTAQLSTWAERILNATCLEDVFADR